MAALEPVTLEFRADPDHLIRFARIVEKHFGALADDLELLRSGQAPDVDPTATQWRSPCPHCRVAVYGRDEAEAHAFLAEHYEIAHKGQAPDAWCETCPRCYAAFAGSDRAEAVIALMDHYAAEHRSSTTSEILEQPA
jgi:hypothetical protein